MALGKGAYAIHQSGKWYTNNNIDQMLMERHLNKKARRSSHKNHIKGPKKRTEEDDVRFAQSFEKMLMMVQEKFQKNTKTMETGRCSYENIRKYSLVGGLAWIFAGCIWCITIIGIPAGLQCFKFASLAFWPFRKEIVYENGMFSFWVNLIWILFFGWKMALGNLIIGFLWCITIVGIPFGKQFF